MSSSPVEAPKSGLDRLPVKVAKAKKGKSPRSPRKSHPDQAEKDAQLLASIFRRFKEWAQAQPSTFTNRLLVFDWCNVGGQKMTQLLHGAVDQLKHYRILIVSDDERNHKKSLEALASTYGDMLFRCEVAETFRMSDAGGAAYCTAASDLCKGGGDVKTGRVPHRRR